MAKQRERTNGPKATRVGREERITRVAEKRRLGYTLEQIAAQEGVSTVQIWKDERKLIARLQERQVGEYQDYVALRCDEYRAMRKEAWKEWYRSRADAHKLVTEEGIESSEDAEPSAVDVMRLVKRIATREGRLAEAGYLNVILKTWEQEDKLRGFVKNTTTVNNTNNVSSGNQDLWEAMVSSAREAPCPIEDRMAALPPGDA